MHQSVKCTIFKPILCQLLASLANWHKASVCKRTLNVDVQNVICFATGIILLFAVSNDLLCALSASLSFHLVNMTVYIMCK